MVCMWVSWCRLLRWNHSSSLASSSSSPPSQIVPCLEDSFSCVIHVMSNFSPGRTHTRRFGANHNIFQKCSGNKSTFSSTQLCCWVGKNIIFINLSITMRERERDVDFEAQLGRVGDVDRNIVLNGGWCIVHEFVVKLKDCSLMTFKLFSLFFGSTHKSMSRIRSSDEQTCWCVNVWILSRSITHFFSFLFHDVARRKAEAAAAKENSHLFHFTQTPSENSINMSIF